MNDRIFGFAFVIIAFFVLGFTISRAVFKSESSEIVSNQAQITDEQAEPSADDIKAAAVIEALEDRLATTTEEDVANIDEEGAEDEEDIIEENIITVTVTDTPTGWLNVREGPGISYNKVKTINPGETYTFLEERYGWYKIQLDEEQEGWIASQYGEKS